MGSAWGAGKLTLRRTAARPHSDTQCDLSPTRTCSICTVACERRLAARVKAALLRCWVEEDLRSETGAASESPVGQGGRENALLTSLASVLPRTPRPEVAVTAACADLLP